MNEVVNQPVSQAEIEAVIVELEQYRQRLINDIINMGKKIKLSHKKVEQNINEHPEINKIDQILKQLRAQIGS
ncbi:MAG TPA: acetyltransferase [Geminocystis sp. M7585_C2015_104]|nr:acetyltransferase [Geminocystis sp. M7585_C2015_104]